MSPISTHMMLILPSDYKRIWKEKHGESETKPTKLSAPNKHLNRIGTILTYRRTSDLPALKFAEIRKSSGRVGENRFRYLEDIGSITITEDFTPQKRWYKTMVAYNEQGMKNGKPQVEFLYFFIDAWIMERLVKVADKNKEQNHLQHAS